MRTGRARLGCVAAAIALVLAGSSCSGDDTTIVATTTIAPPVETTTTTEVPIEGGEQKFVYEPAVGDCFDLRRLDEPASRSSDQVDIVLVVDCTLPHRYEVFDVLSYSNDFAIFPGDSSLEQFRDLNCTKNFDGYVGQTYELSTLDIGFWSTPEDQWDSGPQPFACTLVDPAGDPMTGSMAGSAR